MVAADVGKTEQGVQQVVLRKSPKSIKRPRSPVYIAPISLEDKPMNSDSPFTPPKEDTDDWNGAELPQLHETWLQSDVEEHEHH